MIRFESSGGLLEDALAALLEHPDSGASSTLDEVKSRFPLYESELENLWRDLRLVNGSPILQTDVNRNTARPRLSGLEELPRWPRFAIEAVAGIGSQGVVYRAIQEGTQRRVALKVIRHGAFSTPAERRRFELEIELASRLSHPHIVSIYECGAHEGQLYCAMEYVDGIPLDSYARLHLHDLPSTVNLFRMVCEAVVHAHRRGVLHRDLKPSNIIVDTHGFPHIVDFGLAKHLDARESIENLTSPGEFAGTWHYASPEQVRCESRAVDMRTDVYALGVILYELLTDCSPYPLDNHSHESMVRHVLYTEPVAPATIRPELDRALCTILLTALQKDPARRYASVEALHDDLSRWENGEPIAAQRDRSWFMLKRLVHRHRWKVASATLALIALVVVATIMAVLYTSARTAHSTANSRTALVRASQNFALARLGKLSRMSNLLAALRSGEPASRHAWARMELRPHPAPAVFLKLALGELDWLPSCQYGWVPFLSHPISAQAEQRRDKLIQANLASWRIELPTSKQTSTDYFLNHQSILLPEIDELVRHLVAMADCSVQGDAGFLEAAYSLIQDLSDGPQWIHKAHSVVLLDCLLDRWFKLVEKTSFSEERVVLLQWALQLAPPPAYQAAMILEHEKLAQLIEVATYANGHGAEARVAEGKILEAIRQRDRVQDDREHNEHNDPALSEVVRALETYFGQVEEWDKLSARELRKASDSLRGSLTHEPGWSLVRSIAPSFEGAFLLRARVGAKISAARTLANLSATRIDLQSAQLLAERDPYTGISLGISIQDGSLLIYSCNDDGIDNGARPGDWAQTDTDVIFVRIPWPTPSIHSRIDRMDTEPVLTAADTIRPSSTPHQTDNRRLEE